MIPKDPVYLLTAAVERVKDTIPDQDADDWLRDAIAADRITWAYVWIKKDQYGSWPSPIDILPMAAIMEVPDLEIDWLKGTAAVRQRYRGVVEYPVVVSRHDLDRELANFTASQETAPTPQENDERPEYTPPYVAFMHRATQEMSLGSGTRTPKETIKFWLRENWPDQLGNPTKNKIERMATFLRHPEDERGGYFKPNRDE